MYDWTVEKRIEPNEFLMRWGESGEFVERGAVCAAFILKKKMVGVKLPNFSLVRSTETHHFQHPDNLLALPLVFGPPGRAVFNYVGGVYTGLAQTVGQDEYYYIETHSLLRLQTAWASLFSYYPNPAVFSLDLPFGIYGLPAPISAAYLESTEQFVAAHTAYRNAVLPALDGSIYNVVNRSIEWIGEELNRLLLYSTLFTHI